MPQLQNSYIQIEQEEESLLKTNNDIIMKESINYKYKKKLYSF